MKEFKEKGFTLIELLATIVILGIIALITVPTVKKVMDNARRKAFEDTAYGIIKAGDLYYSKKDMMDEIDGDMTFTFPDNAEELDLQGKLPENGTMQINEDGEISIFITNDQYCITKNYKEKDITVTEDVESCLPPVMVENITVTNNNVSINKGKTSKIEVNFVPTTATNKKLKYTSSNTNVAKVDENGLITGVGAGNATITVSTTDSSNISKTINVTVKELVSSITVNTASISIVNGGTYQLTTTASPSSADNKVLKYTSSNTSVATVSNTGLITGVTGGTATITVSTTDGSNISKTVSVTVRQLITSLELSTSSVNLNVEESATVTATILPTNAYNKTLNWASNDTSVATVSNGTITGVSAGTTTITVSTTDGSNISKTINVTVKEPVKTLTSLATTSTEVTSIPECITNNTTCTAGTPVAIKVNKTETYNFYVISETDNKVTLIMDRNLGDNVIWISAEDYAIANVNGTSCGEAACSNKGPVTALNALKERTSGWTNISEKEYTYSDDGGGNMYTAFTETMRARMLTYTEATTTLGCTTSDGSCPSWLYINLRYTGSNTDSTGADKNGYWISAANARYSNSAFNVRYNGSVNSNYTNFGAYGVRPVIELSKSL